MSRSRRAQGFSLLELMIALAIGGLAISSIYSIGAASTRTFQQQQQVATAQTSLRIAMNQLKRDIARAGYLATPNATAPGQSCGPVSNVLDQPGGSGRLAAISAYQNGVLDTNVGINTGGFNRGNGYTTDDIVLTANYATSDEYPGLQVLSATQIAVNPNWQSFSRDFNNWYSTGAVGVNQEAFDDAFPVGRMIRIQTTQRGRHFAVITAKAGLNLTFAPALPPSCDANGGWVAPVSTIRYRAANAAAANEAERSQAAIAMNETIGQLLREEVLPSDKVTPLDANNPARSILDYLVRFKLSFTMTDRAGLNPGFNWTNNNLTAGIDNPALVNANPERVRSVRIEIGARSPQVDRNLPWSNSCDGFINPGKPLCYQVSDKEPAAARVRVLRAEVLVPNIAFEDL